MKDLNTIKYLESLKELGSNYGLDRTERLLELLGNPHKALKLIHITGTNGKGSTSVILGNILMEHGYKIGFFNSPYLEDIEETIRINNINIQEEELVNLIEEIKPYINKLINEGYSHPTEFEVITCIMFLYFYRKKVDFGIIEVGLGGRLDSTNVILPILSIITPISFDHMNILGNTIEEITREKVEIIKKNIPVVSYFQEESVLKIIIEKAIKENSSIAIVNKDKYKFLNIEHGEVVTQNILAKIKDKDEVIKLSLLGNHQIINLSLAIEALLELEGLNYIKLEIDKLKKATSKIKWKGRLEILQNNPLIIIDGAHNVSGINCLKDSINQYFNYNKLFLILGILKDKEVNKILKTIIPMANKIYTVTSNSIRAKDTYELREEVLKYNSNCIAFENYEEAIKEVLQDANYEDLILVAGSLYMIGKMRSIIKDINGREM